jgi:arsenate reductase
MINPRAVLAEFVGTMALVAAIVGAGWMGEDLANGQPALQLLAISASAGAVLTIFIIALGPVSGAHFNPAVSLVAAQQRLINGPTTVAYIIAQVAGACAGAIIANVMFESGAVSLSATERTGGDLWFSEVIATAGLIILIFGLIRVGKVFAIGPVVGLYIAAAHWFTSSTSFANPAVAVGRMLTDSITGIAPESVPLYIGFELVGAVVGAILVAMIWVTKATKNATGKRAKKARR